MARHRTHNIAFKRQVAQEFLAGETLHGLSKRLSFDPQLKPYLIQLKSHFTSIELRYVIHLQSVYAMRIYELLKQYRKIGERVLPIVELRHMLGILPHKYQYINDFRRYAIDIAQRESMPRPTSASTTASANKGAKSPISALSCLRTRPRRCSIPVPPNNRGRPS